MKITANDARARLADIEKKFYEGTLRKQKEWSWDKAKYRFTGRSKDDFYKGCRAPDEDPRYCPVHGPEIAKEMCEAGQCDMPCGRC